MKCPACLHSSRCRRQGGGVATSARRARPRRQSRAPPSGAVEIEVSNCPRTTRGRRSCRRRRRHDRARRAGRDRSAAPKDYSEVADLPAPRDGGRSGRRRSTAAPADPSIPPPRQRLPTPARSTAITAGLCWRRASFSSGPLPGLGRTTSILPAPVDPGGARTSSICRRPVAARSARWRSPTRTSIWPSCAEERGPRSAFARCARIPEDLDCTARRTWVAEPSWTRSTS